MSKPADHDDIDFSVMAEKREEEAAVLSDDEIYRSMMSKFFEMGMPTDMVAAMIFDTIADHDFVFKELENLFSKGTITESEKNTITEIIQNRINMDN